MTKREISSVLSRLVAEALTDEREHPSDNKLKEVVYHTVFTLRVVAAELGIDPEVVVKNACKVVEGKNSRDVLTRQ